MTARPLCLVSLVFVLALAASLWLLPPDRDQAGPEDGRDLVLTGTVAAKEDHTDSRGERTLRMTLDHVTAEEGDPAEGGAVLCICAPEADGLCPIGARVRVEGRASSFRRASNPGGFEERTYYQSLGIAFRLREARVLAVSASSGDPAGDLLYRARRFLAGILEKACSDPEAEGILRAMLLGDKSILDADTKSLYQGAGIIAVLTISGLHISLLGTGLYAALKKAGLPAPACVLVTVLFMAAYGKMTGMSASVVRALVMFALRLGAGLLGRTYDMPTAIGLSAILLLVRQPLCLVHTGFLFSFGAVLALSLLAPALTDPDMPGPLRGLVQTLSVPLACLPVSLCTYYSFPLCSILLNLAVTPLMAPVLVSGLLGLALGAPAALFPAGSEAGALFGDLAWAALVPARWILKGYDWLCRAALGLPGATLILGAPAPWQAAAYLGILVLVVLASERIPLLVRYVALAAAVSLLTLRVPSRGLELDMIDVGQGDGFYLEYEGLRILVDGGSSSAEDVWTYTIMPFLKYKGAGHLDYLILSHDDDDHMNGMLALLEGMPENGFSVSCLLMPDVGEEMKESGNYQALVRAADDAGVPVSYVSAGDRISRGDLRIHVLHPRKGAVYGEANWYSTTLCLTLGDFSALLTGDLEEEGEEDFLREARERTDLFDPAGNNPLTLLKAGHHGSKNATSPDLLDFFSPRTAFFSCGRNNRYGHPAPETRERLEEAGARIYDTRTDGAVCLHTDGKRLRIDPFLKGDP